MLKEKAAIPFLVGQGLQRGTARQLIAEHNGGLWRTQQRPDRPGRPIILLPPDLTEGQSKQSTAEISQSETTQLTRGSEHPISADRMDTAGGNMLFPPPSPDAAFRNHGLFPPSHSEYPPSRENGDAEQAEDIYEEDRVRRSH